MCVDASCHLSQCFRSFQNRHLHSSLLTVLSGVVPGHLESEKLDQRQLTDFNQILNTSVSLKWKFLPITLIPLTLCTEIEMKYIEWKR